MTTTRTLWLAGLLLAAGAGASCNLFSGVDDFDFRAGATSGGGQGEGGQGGGGGPPSVTSQVDLLLVVDNSTAMADKEAFLSLSIPDLVQGLVNPPCVDPAGKLPDAQPSAPTEPCPAGLVRAHNPIRDLHIGVISSSLGGHGSDSCVVSSQDETSKDDKGHLLARTAPVAGQPVPTYADKGFLAWDPGQTLSPPGEADLDADSNADEDTTALLPSLVDMVLGVGEVGCDYESQLESWYRFLVDPEPYASISVQGGSAVVEGVDTALLAQRADFLRPESLLAILVLSDENDCSIRESGQFFYAAQMSNANGSRFHLPAPRSECAENPNDLCCRSCGQAVGSCPVDPTCTDGNGAVIPLDDLTDALGVRCYDQKRRFGIDFLYPIERYVDALTQTTIANRQGELVPNPIFLNPDPNGTGNGVRPRDLVVMAGVVGVPWQDIARQDAAGVPDLKAGLDGVGRAVGGFKSAAELDMPSGGFPSTWALVLGEPENYLPPGDPHMIESIDPRVGTNPLTGDAIAPPGAPNGTNAINGHEYTIASRDDLQYACIFPVLPGAERDCSSATTNCDCVNGSNDKPLCEPNPNSNNKLTLQVRAKAYPSVRELSVLRALGPRGVVGSACPATVDDSTAVDFAYRPAMRALLDAMAPHLL